MILRMTQLEVESDILVHFTTASLSVTGFSSSNSWLCATLVTQIFTKTAIMSWCQVISVHLDISKLDDTAVPSSAEMVLGQETEDTRISYVSCSCQNGLETSLSYAWASVLLEGAQQTCVAVRNGISQTILVMAILEEELSPLLCISAYQKEKKGFCEAVIWSKACQAYSVCPTESLIPVFAVVMG